MSDSVARQRLDHRISGLQLWTHGTVFAAHISSDNWVSPAPPSDAVFQRICGSQGLAPAGCPPPHVCLYEKLQVE